jgi:hypothetical protein
MLGSLCKCPDRLGLVIVVLVLAKYHSYYTVLMIFRRYLYILYRNHYKRQVKIFESYIKLSQSLAYLTVTNPNIRGGGHIGDNSNNNS